MRRNDRGLALILVLTVILALAIIATPFVLSMLKQEKSATTHKSKQKSDAGSTGASNWAVYFAMQGADWNERTVGATPYEDPIAEFRPPMNDSRLQLDSRNPAGNLWGAALQDEQSKLNIRSCPESALVTLKQLVDPRINDPRDYLTQWSVREARWIFPQRVRFIGTINLPGGAGTINNGVSVDNAGHYGVGARLKFSRPGSSFETRVTVNYVFSTGMQVVETDPPAPTGFSNGVVEVEARHPVNTCTARREVLQAMFTNLRINVGGTSDAITPDEARAVADATYLRPFNTYLDWATVIANLTQLSNLDKVAVIINALDPTMALLEGSGTVPICFVNRETVTVEGRTVTSAKSGAPVSKSRFREVIDIAPPIALARTLVSQYDFDARMNAAVVAAGAYGAYFNGYPWGSRHLTTPNPPPNPSDQTFTAASPAYFQLATGVELRGTSQYSPLLQPTEHFPAELEGMKLGGSPITYLWNRVFTSNPSPPAPTPLQNWPDVTAGGISCWIRFDAAPASPTNIYDIRESDTMNRITLRYEGGQLVFTVTDCSAGDPAVPLDKGWAEIRHPFTPLTETWYHIAAYWKGTRYGHLCLLVDGFSDPTATWKLNDEDGRPQMTELSSDLQQASTGLSLKDVTWIPDPTPSEPGPVPLLIGGEVVEYDKATGAALRGARNTTAAFHPRGAKVCLFGYSEKLQPLQVNVDLGALGTLTMIFDRLPRVTGQVQYSFGQAPAATVAGDKNDPGPPPTTYIDATQNIIPVNSPGITDFPQKGYVKIENEVIYYDSINQSVTPPRFEGCVRGQHGTTAARHDTGRQVQMWAIPMTNTANYLTPTILQIGDEWFGPVQRDPSGRSFYIGVVMAGTPLPLMRGAQVFGSSQTSHSALEDILPVWAGRESDMAVNRWNLVRGDRVTLTDATNNKEMHRIRRAARPMGPFTFNINDTQLAGFFSNTLRDYIPDQQHVRVVKWPSGELLGLNYCQTFNPNFSVGSGLMTVDEIKFFGSPKGNFYVTTSINDVGAVVPMNGAGGLAQLGGALKIGDEIVGYVNVNGNNLEKSKRGWLNSLAQLHDAGDLAFNLSFLPIATLTTDMGDTDSTVSLSQPLSGEGGYTGYVLVDQEVIGWEWNQGGNRTLAMPQDFTGQGIWRGCFGTQRRTHLTEAMVYGIPFRFRDSYRPQTWDNLMPYYQASWTVRGARWLSITWTEELPLGDTNLVVHCLVRADGVGNLFDAPVLSDDTLVWEFTKGNTANPLMHTSSLRDAGQLDARFMIEYLPGSFWPNHSWKRAPRIRRVDAQFDRETKVLFHEEK
jgi:hypothetical protein